VILNKIVNGKEKIVNTIFLKHSAALFCINFALDDIAGNM